MSDMKCGRFVGTSVSIVCGGSVVCTFEYVDGKATGWYHECKRCGGTFPERAASGVSEQAETGPQ